MSAPPGLVWDACALLNLLATREEIRILKAMRCSSYVVAEVLRDEVLHLRPLPEEDPLGRLVAADTSSLLHDGQLTEVSLGPTELATFVRFAAFIDDGEARSAAVALHRGFRLVTDDRKSL